MSKKMFVAFAVMFVEAVFETAMGLAVSYLVVIGAAFAAVLIAYFVSTSPVAALFVAAGMTVVMAGVKSVAESEEALA